MSDASFWRSQRIPTASFFMEAFYLRRNCGGVVSPEAGAELFSRFAAFFDSDVSEGVTSAELLASSLVRVLEEVFSNPDEELANAARSAFVQVFMSGAVRSRTRTHPADS